MSRSFFVDANVFVYAVRESDFQPGSAATLEAIGAATTSAVTSSAVIEELWHLELSGRVPGLDGVAEAAFTLMRPVLPVTDEAVATAFGLVVDKLGANGRIHLATCLVNGIATVLTADQAFDDVPGVRRVDPADLSQVRTLLS
jgi:uncharacterized protein